MCENCRKKAIGDALTPVYSKNDVDKILWKAEKRATIINISTAILFFILGVILGWLR